jgi:hypothetical protein
VKNALMAAMWPTAQALETFADVKKQMPKALADLNAVYAKAAGVAKALEAHKITLKVPAGS